MNESRNESKRAQVANQVEELSLQEQQVETLFRTLDSDGSFDPPVGELSIAFVSKEEISQIHDQFMGDPSATDVITFPGDPTENLAGEICVCPQVALEYAKTHESNFTTELNLYLVHGYLHLCGFDDINEADRAEMRKAESQAMAILEKADAIASFNLK